jgi:hypothetical protein
MKVLIICFLFFETGKKKPLPYINIGEANMGGRAKKKKREGGKRRTRPLKVQARSAYKLRQILSAGKDPVLPFILDLLHDNQGQGRFVVEDPLIPLFPNLPTDKQDCSS